jgi:pyruvate formate lyase activating enzyme
MFSSRRYILTFLLISFLIFPFVPAFCGGVSSPKEASFYEKLKNSLAQCRLCPRECVIQPGKRGYCRVRENRQGTLYSLSYGQPVAIHIDPIEKKPLFHYLPGSKALSLATVGCNMNCGFCQNWEIAQARPEDAVSEYLSPNDLVNYVAQTGSPVIAYTYTEPTVFFEYMLETAKFARARGIKNVIHSNGYINEAPLRELIPYLDAANIDLKGFSEDYYKRVCEGGLEPVLRSLKLLKSGGVHVEITNLVISGYNDDPKNVREMCRWIVANLGADTPVHFSRFFPMYKFLSLIPTPPKVLDNIRSIAMDEGLLYVYIGNLVGHESENTFCPKCRKAVVERSGYVVNKVAIEHGVCAFCGEKISGVWE